MSKEQVEQTCAICGDFVDMKMAKFITDYGGFFEEHLEVYCDKCLEKGQESYEKKLRGEE
jgi:hypothetical protein